MSDREWLRGIWVKSLPPDPETSVVAWAERNVRLPGSARSERFDSSITPWIREPLELLGSGTVRIMTFVKPIQTAGSVLGEVFLNYCLATQNGGDVQYNWEDDIKAGERWDKRIERILKACSPVMRRAPRVDSNEGRHKWKRGMVVFPHCNLTVQGVAAESNLDSDSIRFQINEEIHNWEAGRLKMAYGRTTAFWNSVTLNISNAGNIGDQLHQAHLAGTQHELEVKCPGCGRHHVMRTRWEDNRPELGGLRYDSSKAKGKTGEYNYNLLAPTIRYQMPCGHEIPDEIHKRRQLSLSCRWSEPRNKNAHLSERSYTYDAVAVDYIPWRRLIQEKHEALRAQRMGDNKPWEDYLKRRECRFFDHNDRPIAKPIVLSSTARKNREGLAGRAARFFALDRQRGVRGDTPHWWLVIRDVMPNGDSLLVFEGRVDTDEAVLGELRAHGCKMRLGVADSGDDTMAVYQFCYLNGINCIKGGKHDTWPHEDGSRRIYEPERPLASLMPTGTPLKYEMEGGLYHDDEPMFWNYSKGGIRDRLAGIRAGTSGIKWEVPGDVSEDYQLHMDAERQVDFTISRTGEKVSGWKQDRDRNDLFVCECYIAMMMEKAGFIGVPAIEQQPET